MLIEQINLYNQSCLTTWLKCTLNFFQPSPSWLIVWCCLESHSTNLYNEAQDKLTFLLWIQLKHFLIICSGSCFLVGCNFSITKLQSKVLVLTFAKKSKKLCIEEKIIDYFKFGTGLQLNGIWLIRGWRYFS